MPSAKYQREWRKLHPGRNAEHTRKYYGVNKNKESARKKKHRKEYPEKVRMQTLNSRYKRKYGISYAEKAELLLAQGGCCAICGSDKPGSKLGWDTDHDPNKKVGDAGFVRGILCHPCNQMVHKHVTPLILRKAADYLEKKNG